MEFCDINVRVLYDFEYTTKYGRKINISSGERLLLIKKTNKDWWQVIRSSEQRPFYVPASYVKEVEPKPIPAVRYQSKTKPILDTSENNVPSSSSLPKDSQETNLTLSKSASNLSIHTEKSEVVVKTKDETNITVPTHKSVSNTTMSSSGYNSLCEEVPILEDEAQSVLTGSNSSLPVLVIEERQRDVLVESVTDKPLSDKSDNKPSTSHSQVLHIGSDHGKYSFVHNPKQLSTDMSIKLPPDLPASESLEDLSLQIELKTSSLRNISESKENSLNRKTIDVIPEKSGPKKSCSTGNFHDLAKTGSDPFFKEKIVINLPKKKSKESRSSEDVCIKPQVPVDSSNLQYQGSFKTNIERQRWFNKSSNEQRLRNVQSCSEETTEDLLKDPSKKEEVENVSISEENNIQGTIVTISHFNESDRSNKVDEKMQQSECRERALPKPLSSFLSDSQLSHLKAVKEKTTSRHSLDSVIEGEMRENHTNFPRKYSSSGAQSVVAVHKAGSEKSSTDSLLDLEEEGKCRKISGGTTSDSLVPTDGEDLATSDSETDSVKLAKHKQEEAKSTRKIPLTRRRRVFASKTRPESLDPPSPVDQEPARSLGEGWHEFDTHDGRKYFYNLQTREKRWKPPRRTPNSNAEVEAKAEDEGDGQDTDDMFVVSLPLPSGYRSEVDPSSGQMCYINIHTGARWFSSTDSEGRVYFFAENSNKSSWALPDCKNTNNNENKSTVDLEESSSISNLPIIEKSLNRYVKSKSMILGRYEEPIPLSNNWPQLWDGTMCVLKEGPLNKTKITENGKRVRKNWTSTHAVLTELLLLFFKDNKGFPSMMNGKGGPELSVDLNGAVVDTGDKVSSRKHVYMLSTVLGLQVLIQFDNATAAEQWLDAIQATIFNLPSSFGAKGVRAKSESPSQDDKLNSRISRSKSLKLKNSASIEDLSNIAERQVKIRERLKKFFHRRPTVDQLVKKGIWKDEPVFGCLLEHACPPEAPRVPPFVIHCIRCIERTEENMKTDGLYRASGNLSQVQKIRLQVDQNIYSLLEEEEDVHVLAGTLKLFFRELKQPLIPFRFFNKALSASTNPHRAEKIRDFRDIVRALPACNHDTLKILLQHLLSVTRFHEYNRMHIPNIAIVFGPTLMWPEQESTNMAFDLMQQNLVIECFLSEFHAIFH